MMISNNIESFYFFPKKDENITCKKFEINLKIVDEYLSE